MSADNSKGRVSNSAILTAIGRRFPIDVGGVEVALQDYLYRFGTTRYALLYARLFVPEFMERSGHVLLKQTLSEANAANLAGNLDVESTQTLVSSLNWIEIGYLFGDDGATDDECHLLARLIAEAWDAQLRLLYPHRRFAVSVLPPKVTGSTVGVGFVEVSES